jgi:hypothetical protein
MPRRTFVSRSIALLAAVIAFLALTQPAAASCMTLPPLEKALAAAPLVFVGTANDTQHEGRTATFDVEEIWKGSVGARVFVNGGPTIREMERAEANGQVAATSVDRTYEQGVRYLVVPFGAKGGVLTDNACSSTQPYTAQLASHAPSGAAPPESATSALAPTSSDEDDAEPWQFALVTLGMVALLALALMIARRARRPRTSP